MKRAGDRPPSALPPPSLSSSPIETQNGCFFGSASPKGNIETIRNVSASFSNRYLQTFTKGNDIAQEVKVSFSDEQPMCLRYGFLKNSEVRFYLAPKIPED